MTNITPMRAEGLDSLWRSCTEAEIGSAALLIATVRMFQRHSREHGCTLTEAMAAHLYPGVGQ